MSEREQLEKEIALKWLHETVSHTAEINFGNGRTLSGMLADYARLRLREVEQERERVLGHILQLRSFRYMRHLEGCGETANGIADSLAGQPLETTAHKWRDCTCGLAQIARDVSTEAEESESEMETLKAQAGKLAAAARLQVETDPFSYTINGDDTCQWCRRDKPMDGGFSEDTWWSEDFHNSDCEGQRIAIEAKSALTDWEKEN